VGTPLIEKFGDGAVINRIDGAEVHYGGRTLTLRRKGVAHVIDRTAFDRSFSEGLDVSHSSRVTAVTRRADGRYDIATDHATFSADMVVGADGPCSIVRRSLPFDSSVTLYGAYQQCVRTDLDDESAVIVDVVRPFFAWAIPEGNGIVRAGIVGKASDLERFKESHGICGEVIASFAAPIPVGKTCPLCGNAALVGDAAAQTKPLSGGGLYYGMCAAELLAESVGSGNLDVLCEVGGRIESEGDYDNHSSLARILIGNPRLLAVLGKNLFSLIG
jgi:flavin-dependent dehydrogenase